MKFLKNWRLERVRFATLIVSSIMILATVLVVHPSECSARGASVFGARLGEEDRRTRFVLDISKPVSYSARTLANPPRIVIDLSNVDFDLSPNVGREGVGLVSGFRYGLVGKGRSRIVLDIDQTAVVQEVFVIKNKTNLIRLVVDIVPANKLGHKARDSVFDSSQSVPVRAVPAYLKRQPAPPGNSPRPLIVIDPGHGGVDPGAVSQRGQREKDIVLAFAKRLSSALKKMGGVNVQMTRSTDVFVRLGDRVKFARRMKAGLFLSIHADSVANRSSRSASGATLYTLSTKGSSTEARAMAAKENRSDIVAGFDAWNSEPTVSAILISLSQNLKDVGSRNLAQELLSSLKGRVNLNRRPHRTANFRVLRTGGIDAVLLELGYLSNPVDAKKLNSRKWHKKTAKRVACALLIHLKVPTPNRHTCNR